MIKVAPSLLSADFARLGEEVERINQSGADYIHIDVMDGCFVPNLTIGSMVVRDIKPFAKLPLDVHLMVANPEILLDSFIAARADRLILHQEIEGDVMGLLESIKERHIQTGICLKPHTPADTLLPFLDLIDVVLVMTVEPGFGGQSFMEQILPKITQVREMIGTRAIELEVDGGINIQTGRLCVNAGADVLVAGNYLFKSLDFKKAVQSLKETDNG